MWTKLDDGFYDHPKVLSCGLEAIGVHALALSYCGRHCTGGHIPRNAPFVQGRTRLVKELLRAGLWEQTDSGWRIHDWSDYNPTAEEARDYQRRMHEVRRQGGKARAASASRVAGRFAPAPTSNTAGESAPAATSPVPVLDPSTIKDGSSRSVAHASNVNGESTTPTAQQRLVIEQYLEVIKGASASRRPVLTEQTEQLLTRKWGLPVATVRAWMLFVAEDLDRRAGVTA